MKTTMITVCAALLVWAAAATIIAVNQTGTLQAVRYGIDELQKKTTADVAAANKEAADAMFESKRVIAESRSGLKEVMTTLDELQDDRIKITKEIGKLEVENRSLRSQLAGKGNSYSAPVSATAVSSEPENNEAYSAEVAADIRLSGGSLEIKNLNSYAWTDIKFSINPKFFSSGYVKKTNVLAPGKTASIMLSNFVNGDGERFNLVQLAIKEITITCKKPDGGFGIQCYGMTN